MERDRGETGRGPAEGREIARRTPATRRPSAAWAAAVRRGAVGGGGAGAAGVLTRGAGAPARPRTPGPARKGASPSGTEGSAPRGGDAGHGGRVATGAEGCGAAGEWTGVKILAVFGEALSIAGVAAGVMFIVEMMDVTSAKGGGNAAGPPARGEDLPRVRDALGARGATPVRVPCLLGGPGRHGMRPRCAASRREFTRVKSIDVAAGLPLDGAVLAAGVGCGTRERRKIA